MPPKAKKKTPKAMIKELEETVAALTAAGAADRLTADETAVRLAATIDGLKAVILTASRERDALHDATEKELRVELAAAKAELASARDAAAHASADAAAVAALQAERLGLLRQVTETVASREAAEKLHASEIHELQARITSLKR
jgi:hypothetical protein